MSSSTSSGDGTLIVLTAPFTETIDHAGYFIQMSMASLPIWLEGILNSKYPKWRNLEYNDDGSARYMPAGVRLARGIAAATLRGDDIVCCYPDDLDKFIGPETRVVAISTHNPLGRHVRGRCLHVDLRIVEGADQLALRASAVRRRSKPIRIATISR